MRKKVHFNYSFSDMGNKTREIVKLVKEDLDKFKNYGVTNKELDSVIEMITEFEKFPEDKLLFDKVSIHSTKKSEKEELLKTEIRNILLRIQIALNSKMEMKKLFKSQKVVGRPIDDLIQFGEKVIKTAKQNKTKLTKTGFKQEELDNLKELLEETKDVVQKLETAKQNRTETTQLRQEKAGEIYEMLVKYSIIGKTLWKDKNPKRYKLYLLYSDYYDKVKKKK